MTFTLRISAAARGDLEEAEAWYDGARPGLGGDFVHSVEDTLARILNHPEAYALTYGPYRRVLVRRFSYAVFSRLEKKAVKVTAVLHTSRSPAVWCKRLSLH